MLSFMSGLFSWTGNGQPSQEDASNPAFVEVNDGDVQASIKQEDIEEVEYVLACFTHYRVLRIERDATRAEVRMAYRVASLKVHPDKNRYEKANDAFVMVNEAFQTLFNNETRRKYDVSIPTEAEELRLEEEARRKKELGEDPTEQAHVELKPLILYSHYSSAGKPVFVQPAQGLRRYAFIGRSFSASVKYYCAPRTWISLMAFIWRCFPSLCILGLFSIPFFLFLLAVAPWSAQKRYRGLKTWIRSWTGWWRAHTSDTPLPPLFSDLEDESQATELDVESNELTAMLYSENCYFSGTEAFYYQAPDGSLLDITVLLEARLMDQLAQEVKRETEKSAYRRGSGRRRSNQPPHAAGSSTPGSDPRAERRKKRKEARLKKKERQDQFSTHAKPKVRQRKAF